MSEGYTEPEYEELPELTDDARTWGVISHLAALLMFPLPGAGQIIGPLVVWMIKGKEHPFIDANGRESVNFQISISIYMTLIGASVFLCIGILFLPLIPVLFLIDIVLIIYAAIQAGNGRVYRYPITIRFIK